MKKIKKILIFTFITVFSAVLFFVPVRAKASELNNSTNSYELKPMSMIIYFYDYLPYVGPTDYVFNLSHIDEYYDYFIFNFGNDDELTLYYGDGYMKELNLNTGFGVRLIDRNDLKWEIQFNHSFMNNDYYILATNYDFIYNLPYNLSNEYYDGYDVGYDRGSLDSYDVGYDRGSLDGYDVGYDKALDDVYEYGFTPLDTEYENQDSWPYQLGYYNGVESVEIIDWEDAYNHGYNIGYDSGVEKVFNDGFGETNYNDNKSYSYYLGYNNGIDIASDNTFYGIISQVFIGIGTFLAIELLPNITFGAILAVPLVFGIIAFIIGKRGGKDD